MKKITEEGEEKTIHVVFKICLEAWARICKRLRSPEIDSATLCTLAGRYIK